jgi:sigma-B regulation protein RsbU (phosphoserine phosphatase)
MNPMTNLQDLATGPKENPLAEGRRLPGQVLRELQEDALQAICHDYLVAAEIQARLLQVAPPRLANFELAAHSRPASHLSGDFYDFIRFGTSHLGILVGDAMGKGLAASLLMVQARAVVKSLATVCQEPAELLRRANRLLSADLGHGMFVTLLLAVLDLSSGDVRVANAGHLPILLWHAESGQCSELSIGGFALGVAKEALFDRSIIETSFRLKPGDRFVMYSDGVTELHDLRKQEYGKGRLIRSLFRAGPRTSDCYLEALLNELEEHRSGFSQSDDLTLVTGRALPGAGSRTLQGSAVLRSAGEGSRQIHPAE